ncbi:unnamed protein product [Rotaria sordida]|uniref:Serine protease n=2 Tax=Rotaria sordida TaxID=392033 RepID=A0A815HFE2_9BILA|nr:unnamed protein product [Rotaria sordida]
MISNFLAEDSSEIPADLRETSTVKYPSDVLFWGAIFTKGLIPQDGHLIFTKWLHNQRQRICMIDKFSEEQQVILSEINKISKFVSAERAFFNAQLNSVEQTYTYIYDDSNCKIDLPNISCEDVMVLSLLSIRKLILRIEVIYEHKRTIEIYFGSGFLLNDRLVLTCAHSFDPIQWGKEKVPYKKIHVCYSDPAYETFFSSVNPSNLLIAATVIRRGLEKDNLSNYDELKSDSTDLAILALDKAVTHLQFNEYFEPKLNCSSSKSGAITINSKLFLVSYNGELTDDDALKPYRYLKGPENLTIEKLNYSHHVNYKSISIGNLIQESSSDNQYGMHNCTILPGSSGALIIGSAEQFVETFNKFIPVNSKLFVEFIREAIVPNIVDDELVRKWQAVFE